MCVFFGSYSFTLISSLTLTHRYVVCSTNMAKRISSLPTYWFLVILSFFFSRSMHTHIRYIVVCLSPQLTFVEGSILFKRHVIKLLEMYSFFSSWCTQFHCVCRFAETVLYCICIWPCMVLCSFAQCYQSRESSFSMSLSLWLWHLPSIGKR